MWAHDYYAVNGSDETFQGWGSEDKDLAVHLLNNSIKIKNSKCYSYVIHLWHPLKNRQNDKKKNTKVINRLKNSIIFPTKGLD